MTSDREGASGVQKDATHHIRMQSQIAKPYELLQAVVLAKQQQLGRADEHNESTWLSRYLGSRSLLRIEFEHWSKEGGEGVGLFSAPFVLLSEDVVHTPRAKFGDVAQFT